MAEICVIYGSEDEDIVVRLVNLLRRQWDVWWSEEISHGPWEDAARKEIEDAKVVLAVLSQHTNGKGNFRGELQCAYEREKPIFPFVIGAADIPLTIKDLSRTDAIGWTGDGDHKGFQRLRAKLAKVLGSGSPAGATTIRPREMIIRGKTLCLPAFIFSLSSHETQVSPYEGATLLRLLEPGAALVSAYDAWKYKKRKDGPAFRRSVREFRKSDAVLFLDSGNYEAFRKGDRYSKQQQDGWRRDRFLEIATKLPPDIAFTFDCVDPSGEPARVAANIVKAFRSDDRSLSQRDFLLCPIIHLPKKFDESIAECAAHILSSVAAELDPPMLAIPERELGNGLQERAKSVRDIRKALNALGKYYPLHLLGTGNPLSMIALAAAGADSFDGLEWCRTVADYPSGHLFHFQQFDCFEQACLHRVQNQSTRRLIENPKVSYTMKTLAYNVDFFSDWTRTMRNMIHSGQIESLLNNIPNIGMTIFKDLSE